MFSLGVCLCVCGVILLSSRKTSDDRKGDSSSSKDTKDIKDRGGSGDIEEDDRDSSGMHGSLTGGPVDGSYKRTTAVTRAGR